MKNKFILAFLFWLFLLPLFSFPSDTINLSNSRYYPAVLKAIQNASKSISVCMYYISYTSAKNGKVEQILNAMADAVKRGVKVEVVLDRGFESAGESDMSKKNIRAYSFLKKAGIPVYYDDIETLTHAKYFVIDEKIVIVGSFNLSENALSSNREAGLQVESKEIAKEFEDEFKTIPRFTPGAVDGAIPIPREFIRNKDLAPAMIWKGRKLIDLYLLLQYRSYKEKTDKVILTKEDILQNFYYDTERNFKGRGVLATFKEEILRQSTKFSFFKSYEHDEKNQQFVFYLNRQNKAEEDALYLSELYWTDGWFKRLEQKSKVCLMYILDKTDSGRMGRSFSQKKMEAVEEYGIKHQMFAYGTGELQRWNLIEKLIYAGKGSVTPNEFILNSFYVYADFEKDLGKIKAKTDPAIFKVSMEIADLVNEPCDISAIQKIIELGEKYGVKNLESVEDKIKSRSGTSPYRRLFYVLAIIRNKGEGK